VGAYWVSIVEGQTTFASQAINALLKDLGYQVGNITDAITQCMREKPAWIIQTRKSGSTKQSRKEYKLTEAGRRRVIAMLSVATEK
jgi:DNA-binding HxlR family transcriptional regulator